MRSLAARALEEEQMDAPDLDSGTYARILGDLARVNGWTLARRPTIAFLSSALGGARRFRLLDVGFGHGDMLRAIARWARHRGISAELVGVDLNPKSAEVAEAATPAELGIRFHSGDYREVGGGFDFIVSNLVAHHMTPRQLRDFLRYMEAEARRGWMVNDLHRHRLAYFGFPLLCRIMGWHRIIRQDGQLSIARSFRPDEWRAILADAGISTEAARIVRRFPFRLCVERLR
ncbi:MAG TPA: methyltransferase domain-containing protein [Allosphingosinicella sp.]|jgi:SAM-dependent methyltransferase